MTQIFRLPGTTLGFALLTLCQGCASGQIAHVPIQLISNSDITVVQATAHRKLNGIAVGGDVRRPNGYAGTVPGYLRVVGRDEAGKVIATTTGSWGEFMSRRFRLAYFKNFLTTDNSSVIASISIEPVTIVHK